MIYVLSAIFALLVLIGILLYINVTLRVRYDQDENVFWVTLHYPFVNIVIAPEEETKKYKKKKKKKTDSKSPQKKYKKKSMGIKEKGIGQFVEDLKDIVRGAWTLIRNVLKRAVLKKFKINLLVTGEDAADTAIIYGYANAVIYPIVSAFTESVKEYKDLDVNITPDFSEEANPRVEFFMELKLKPAKLLGAIFESREAAVSLLSALSNKSEEKTNNENKDIKETSK